MPCQHRILQEICAAGGDISVLQAMIEADVERNTLLEEEKQLVAKLRRCIYIHSIFMITYMQHAIGFISSVFSHLDLKAILWLELDGGVGGWVSP